jgi:hypothetical protein
VATTSLEVHRPSASSDNVSNSSCTQLFCSRPFLIQLFLYTLMQKFLSLGAECIGIQESADASQGMPIVSCCFLLLYPCLFVFP